MIRLFGRKKKQDENNNVQQPDAQVSAMEFDGDELIAVITAALNACIGAQSNLIVRKITRVGDSTPVWGRIGRQEQMLNRL